ncbi:glutaredoxin domain-containing protein [Methylobacterium sp. AMS5]|uniref:glutaredoxin domain-containing protein n=1 Tax=Methylobacterium sp. AMS5 TaxID=925818 RepID=UPI00074F83ED|nr:glutaredoxin domain-containing protein [Methylobacterium sp. AMS5]AMB48269.1 glutaredoxin [Methylobacterium sp. AMS5]
MQTIRIYGRKNCIWCSRAVQLAEARKLTFAYSDVNESPAARDELIARMGQFDTLPQIFVGETHVGGFTQLATADKRGELQQMIGGA